MTEKRKITLSFPALVLVVIGVIFVFALLLPVSLPNSSSAVVYADGIPAGCPGGPDGPKKPGTKCPALANSKTAAHCKSNQTAVKITSGRYKGKWYCQDKPTAHTPPSAPSPAHTDCNYKSGCDLIARYVQPLINFLSVLFGLVAVASIIMGGINYATSEGDPQKAAQAKSRIYNTLIAIFAYLFLYAFLQFLIPGGLFH